MTNTAPSLERYDLPITVQPQDIDVMGHVNNTVYVRWVQEAAVAHWTSSASPEELESVVWVVVRHELDYLSSVKLTDMITARTWVGATVKNYFERFTEIRRTADGKVLSRARTLWCPLDKTTLRPVRAGAELIRRWSVTGTPSAI